MCDAGCDAGPLSSIVWANFLASGWFVQLAHSCYLSKSAHCYFLSCYFFSYLPTVSFSLLLLSYCYPDWINGTITYFPNTCILTCPLLLSFLFLFFPTCPLFLFFLSLYSYCYPNELLLSFPLVHCYFLSCYFFSYLSVHCYFLSCYFFSCYFFSYLKLLLSFLLPFFLLLSFRAPCGGNPQVTNVCTWLVIFKSVWENIYDSIYFGTGQQVFVYNDALIKCFNEPCAHASDIRIMIIWSRQSTVASKRATQGDHPQVLFVECQCGGRSSTVARSVSI